MGKRKSTEEHSTSRHVKVNTVEKESEVETPYLGKAFLLFIIISLIQHKPVSYFPWYQTHLRNDFYSLQKC